MKDELEKLKEHSMAAHGHFIATQSNRDLNEIAVLRTQLARSKGFKNWAEYQLASNKQHYMPGYQKPSERIEFLKSVLKLTYSTHEKFLHARLQELDSSLRVENLSESQISLLNLPGAVFLKDYFPIENVNEFWQRTMAESGFSESSIKSIQFDNFPRAGKQTHAYMMSARGWKPRHFILDSTSDAGLFLRTPDSRWRNNVNEWDPSLIYIVQNMRTNGIASFRTLFHEGGHGLDFSFREDHLSQGQDSSYTETHSKTMEMFFKDREFIERTAQKLNGEKPSSELIEAYFKNSRWNDFISFRYQISNALYDLELWNREYKSGDDFVQSALDLDEKYQRKYFFGKTETLQGALNSSYGKFATGHFYGGQVRYIGYVFAQMAATMTYERLLDKFEELNGRRTLSEQSTLADELIKGYYTKGFLQPFPQATEVFTGKKFDALAISQSILAQVEHVALRSESSLESRSKKLNAPVCKKIF
nr:M3 family metallopeptidase [Pseudobdellovibrionaceae bacterium]